MQLALNLGDLLPLPPAPTAVAPQHRDYYFFAVMPDAVTALEIDARARELSRRYRLGGRLIGAARYHVSLLGLEPPPGAEAMAVEKMVQAGDAICACAFALRFDQALSFSKNAKMHPLVLSSSDTLPALNALQAALGSAMAGPGATGPGSFTPHVTMLYDRTVVSPTDIPPISWTAHDFVLIKSLRRQSRYVHLRSWPLRSVAPSGTGLS
jgi:2'-5' RNA ligase